jgi:hypothetical protein
MAEIKSAIELAMERTKSLVMDDDEKRDFEAKDVENRLKALLRRFREGLADLDDTRESFREMKGDEGIKRALLVDTLTREFDILDRDGMLIDLLDSLCGLPDEVRKELKAIRSRYEAALEQRAMIVRERILQELHDQGLSGTAVEPNLEGWEQWQQEKRETKDAFQRRIADWKKLVDQFCRQSGSR